MLTNTLQEGGTLSGIGFRGNMAADPRTGYVYTAVGCSGSCPDGATGNEVGIAIGAPQTTPNPANIGQFSSMTYQAAATSDPDGQPMAQPNSLFPVIGMDSNGTLYEAYIEGDGAATTTDALPDSVWHLYYTYSTDAPLHKTWSTPIRVDKGAETQTTDFGWMSVGDPGKLGFVWLGTDRREHPSFQDKGTLRGWHPYMAVTTDGFSNHPTFQQQQVGVGPNHINDMCLQGTVGCITSVGNRNMADFISSDIGPDGALQMTWANDSNLLASVPSTKIPGLPLTETARQVSGPRLIGSGDVNDARFSTAPTTLGIADASGDALYPVDPTQGAQSNQPQLDLTGSRVAWDGSNLVVHVSAADLSSTSSPSLTQGNVWYLTTWQFNHTIYFARAQSNMGGALTFAAGRAASFDRPGLNGQTVATLVDYSGGTTEQGTKTGNEITITVPVADVGNPPDGAVLESTTTYAALDNGAKLFVGPGTGNMPTIVDATPAYDALLSTTSSAGAQSQGGSGGGAGAGSGSGNPAAAAIGSPNTSSAAGSGALAAALALIVLGAVLYYGRRRRATP